MSEGMVDLVDDDGGLGGVDLEGGFVQVLPERMEDRVLIVRDDFSQDPELLEAEGEVLRYSRRKAGAVIVEELFDGSGGHVVILTRTRSKESFNAEKAMKKNYDWRCKDQRTYIVFHKYFSENLR
jgi:hypothetical protein